MSTVIAIQFCKGNFEQLFEVKIQALQEDTSSNDIREAVLPANPDLIRKLQEWRGAYFRFYKIRGEAFQEPRDNFRIDYSDEQQTNFPQSTFDSIKRELIETFNNWLCYDAFARSLKEVIDVIENPGDIRFLIQSNNLDLLSLPWTEWEQVSSCVGIAVGGLELRARGITRESSGRQRILLILGHDSLEKCGQIRVQEDKEILKRMLGNRADIEILEQPTLAKLREELTTRTGYDIMIFSGHSKTEAGVPKIKINGTQFAGINDLREVLISAVNNGLNLVFFNSCAGLALAAEMSNVPQIIIMKELVSDSVAHKFLEVFFQKYAIDNYTIYRSMFEARTRLRDLEDHSEQPFFCASWLPTIYQNALKGIPLWEQLNRSTEAKPLKQAVPAPPPGTDDPSLNPPENEISLGVPSTRQTPNVDVQNGRAKVIIGLGATCLVILLFVFIRPPTPPDPKVQTVPTPPDPKSQIVALAPKTSNTNSEKLSLWFYVPKGNPYHFLLVDSEGIEILSEDIDKPAENEIYEVGSGVWRQNLQPNSRYRWLLYQAKEKDDDLVNTDSCEILASKHSAIHLVCGHLDANPRLSAPQERSFDLKTAQDALDEERAADAVNLFLIMKTKTPEMNKADKEHFEYDFRKYLKSESLPEWLADVENIKSNKAIDRQ